MSISDLQAALSSFSAAAANKLDQNDASFGNFKGTKGQAMFFSQTSVGMAVKSADVCTEVNVIATDTDLTTAKGTSSLDILDTRTGQVWRKSGTTWTNIGAMTSVWDNNKFYFDVMHLVLYYFMNTNQFLVVGNTTNPRS